MRNASLGPALLILGILLGSLGVGAAARLDAPDARDDGDDAPHARVTAEADAGSGNNSTRYWLYVDPPHAEAYEGGNATFRVYALGDRNLTLDLSVHDAPIDWHTSIKPATIRPGAPVTMNGSATLRVEVPWDAPTRNGTVVVRAVARETGEVQYVRASVGVLERSSFMMSVEPRTIVQPEASEAKFRVLVKANRSVTVDLSIVNVSEGWSASLSADSVGLSGGYWTSVNLTLTPTSNRSGDAHVVVRGVARVYGDEAKAHAMVDVRPPPPPRDGPLAPVERLVNDTRRAVEHVIENATRDEEEPKTFALAITPPERWAHAGDEVLFDVAVHSSKAQRISLSVHGAPRGWNASLAAYTLDVPANGTANTTLRVHVPAGQHPMSTMIWVVGRAPGTTETRGATATVHVTNETTPEQRPSYPVAQPMPADPCDDEPAPSEGSSERDAGDARASSWRADADARAGHDGHGFQGSVTVEGRIL